LISTVGMIEEFATCSQSSSSMRIESMKEGMC
jgi:hypothetical protein